MVYIVGSEWWVMLASSREGNNSTFAENFNADIPRGISV